MGVRCVILQYVLYLPTLQSNTILASSLQYDHAIWRYHLPYISHITGHGRTLCQSG